jgi:uncharacterized protein YerC
MWSKLFRDVVVIRELLQSIGTNLRIVSILTGCHVMVKIATSGGVRLRCPTVGRTVQVCLSLQ